MRRRTPLYYLVRTSRASGYALFLLMLLFIVTGFALCGQYGLEQWLSTRQALYLHHLLDGPLIVLFLVHAVGSIYLGLRRRRWVKR